MEIGVKDDVIQRIRAPASGSRFTGVQIYDDFVPKVRSKYTLG
jgi:hypothetical protein